MVHGGQVDRETARRIFILGLEVRVPYATKFLWSSVRIVLGDKVTVRVI